MNQDISTTENKVPDGTEINHRIKKNWKNKYKRFALAALGSIPWVGGIISGLGAMNAENEQGKINELQVQWIEEYQTRLLELVDMLNDVCARFDELGEEIDERIQSSEYISLVKKAFRLWDSAETDEKKQYIKNLLTNSAAVSLCPDDLIRLFMDWIETYHEAHFKVIRVIYQNPGAGRGDIWDQISKERPREDSADADLYKLLIRDLSTGGVIRQARETDYNGNYLLKRHHRSKSSSGIAKSAFDNSDPYVLTELGKQFVHYTMNEVVKRIE